MPIFNCCLAGENGVFSVSKVTHDGDVIQESPRKDCGEVLIS